MALASNTDDDHSPLWQYVTKIEKTGEGGGNWKWKCNFCKENKQGTYTRVRCHLLKISKGGIGACKGVKVNDISDMKKLEQEAAKRIANAQPKNVPLPTDSNSSLVIPKRRRINDSPVAKAFDMNTRKELDVVIARMFYSGGLPFNLARNPYYLNSYTFAANNNLGGYVPPSYNKLRTTLLQQEKANVDRLLAPIKSTWSEKGVSIVSDGWSDPLRRPLINIMVVSESSPMFIKVVDCSGMVKDKNFIADILKKVIIDVGHEKVVQIITDNARNCKAAGEIIEGMFPHIYWTPCVVHTLNLALKNICAAKNVESNEDAYQELHWITEVHGDAIQIKNFIMNHSMRLAILNKFSSIKLLAVADTRFASIVVMLKRFKLMRRALEAMILSEDWIQYRDDDQERARFVRDLVLDEDWWERLSYIVAFTGPIYEMIRVCDTDKPCLHLGYEMWDSMIEKVKLIIFEHEKKQLNDQSSFYDKVYFILVDRWAKNNTPLHCLAHSLNPRYYSERWLTEREGRMAPHVDPEVSDERRKCFRRMFPDDDERAKAFDEYASFSLKIGSFADLDSITSRYEQDPRKWWACFGSNAPLLQKLAFKLLGQPSSSSCAERNWSTYSFIHSYKRNRLAPQRAEDLVYIHNNLRLLSRSHPEYYDEKSNSKMWDIGGDDFGSMDEVSILEVANLTLDVPELESVLFNEDGSENVEEIGSDVVNLS